MNFKTLKSAGPALAVLLWSAIGFAWTLNDVSSLLPLPPKGEIPLLLGTGDDGGRGALLPMEVFESLPHIVVGTDRKALYRESLKVVAFRIDPCFLERGAPYGCRRQIRLVWQPVIASGAGSITMDAAIHTFYDLIETEWQSLIHELRPLAAPDSDEALDVHPKIRSEGLTGPHWSALKKILLKYAGTRSLTRATAMTVDTLGSIWTFSGVDIKQGVMSRIRIPKVNHIAQGFFADITDLKEFRTSIRPMLLGERAWMTFTADSVAARTDMSEEEIKETLQQAVRIENPKLEDTGSVDCISCHIAMNLRLWGERNMRELDWGGDFKESLFTSKNNLKNNSVHPGFVNRLRAFGYFVDEAAISQRLIHESADVLDQIRKWDCEERLR